MTGPVSERLEVRKTLKLYLGGAFGRSESGRTYAVEDAAGEFWANAAAASRKDARDAVVAARGAWAGWSGRTPYNRGQVVYRVAEVLEGRRAQLADEVRRSEGVSATEAEATVDASVDRLVWYVGWADKIAQVLGGTNAVAAPYFNFSVPEPTGVVAVLAPQDSALLGLVSVVAPAIAVGNTVVVATSEQRPVPAVTLGEVLATSDVPAGVVNLLTGRPADTVPTLAAHMDVNALDLTGAAGDLEQAREWEVAAADNLKRIRRPALPAEDWHAEPGLDRMSWLLETKTVWHPIGR